MIIKNILITGASSGIGEALALYYAKQKETENIFICGRNEQRLMAVKAACEVAGHAHITAKVLNITDKSATEQWITEAEKTAHLNLVFANAGVSTLIEKPENNRFESLDCSEMSIVEKAELIVKAGPVNGNEFS